VVCKRTSTRLEYLQIRDIEPLQGLAVEKTESPQEISMTSLKILAAAAIVAISAPAFASDGASRSVDVKVLEFVTQAQPGYLHESRNGDRTVTSYSKAMATNLQAHAPVELTAARRGPKS
jgi:hypothetical protein